MRIKVNYPKYKIKIRRILLNWNKKVKKKTCNDEFD